MADRATGGERIKVVVFSGGRGTASIVRALLEHRQIDLTIFVNAYDDGLSTGALRRYIPGMLGPSDVRKNIIRLMPTNERCFTALRNIMEHRFAMEVTEADALSDIACFAQGGRRDLPDVVLARNFGRLSVEPLERLCCRLLGISSRTEATRHRL